MTYFPGEQHPDRNRIGVFDLLVVVSGRLYIGGEEDQNWAVSPGQMLILCPDKYHYAVNPCDDETCFYWLHFKEAARPEENDAHSSVSNFRGKGKLSRIESYHIMLPKYEDMTESTQVYDLIQRLIRLSTEHRSHAFWQEQQLFIDLLKIIENKQKTEVLSPSIQLAEMTEAYIKRHYRSRISNRDLSEALHFHSNYIIRCMREVFHCTPPMAYLHQYRLDQAKLLLIKTDWTITRIADYV
ncbi:AraC family transcriptional regulator [Gracilibacillus sp. JCM 18860]|uniref:AraC family transcriptional regulator n=1 Tax=Gracilibacillus sp. JCM 18860 TaxID=1306159 RepID=UPI000AA1C0B7